MRKQLTDIPARPRPGFKHAVKERVEKRDQRAHERQLAFELWMGPAGRNMARLHRIITAEPYSVEVSYAGLQSWRKRAVWDVLADDLQAKMSPALKGRFAGIAEAASVEFMAKLLAAAHGETALTPPMVAAARLAFEASGWLPDRRANYGAVTVQVGRSEPSSARLSDEERHRLSSGLVDILDLGD